MDIKMKEECKQYFMTKQFDNVKVIAQQVIRENEEDYEAWEIMGDLQSNPEYRGYDLEKAKGSYLLAASKTEEYRSYFIRKAKEIASEENQEAKELIKDFAGAWADGMIKVFIRVFVIIGAIVLLMLIGK